jgi:hypothetical protein
MHAAVFSGGVALGLDISRLPGGERIVPMSVRPSHDVAPLQGAWLPLPPTQGVALGFIISPFQGGQTFCAVSPARWPGKAQG